MIANWLKRLLRERRFRRLIRREEFKLSDRAIRRIGARIYIHLEFLRRLRGGNVPFLMSDGSPILDIEKYIDDGLGRIEDHEKRLAQDIELLASRLTALCHYLSRSGSDSLMDQVPGVARGDPASIAMLGDLLRVVERRVAAHLSTVETR